MQQDFEDWWNRLPDRIPAGTTVQTWSQPKGHLSATFKFRELDRDEQEVVVDDPLRRITKHDFEMIYGIWEEYCRGVVARTRINGRTVNSTYIIGILRWLDEHPEPA